MSDVSGGNGRSGPVLGLLAGAAAAVLGALILGPLQGSTGERGLELGYFALAAGVLVGAALGKAAGTSARARRVALLAVPPALLGVMLGQWVASAVYIGSWDGSLEFWRHHVFGRNDWTFYLVAGAEGYLVAKRVAEGS
ncbi:hypothetical protein SRB5_66750 [Streptomyces sp. RB5]|uniref:Uncharacterized protein n=2 Tax=Streptomyces smaragdinus TaxID=2585196 RepID=A0A7K0CSJ8_9ACTN|nr:hypothetical protein [Streptomyces smaragdinus]